MTVHDVDLDRFGSGGFRLSHLFSEAGEIRGKDGRFDDYFSPIDHDSAAFFAAAGVQPRGVRGVLNHKPGCFVPLEMDSCNSHKNGMISNGILILFQKIIATIDRDMAAAIGLRFQQGREKWLKIRFKSATGLRISSCTAKVDPK
jgi:hypothetical protein